MLPATLPLAMTEAEGVAEGMILDEGEGIRDIVLEALTGVLTETSVLVNEGREVEVEVEVEEARVVVVVTKDDDPVTGGEEEVNDRTDEVKPGELVVTPDVREGGTGAITLGTPSGQTPGGVSQVISPK